MLSEVSQTQKDNFTCSYEYIWKLKQIYLIKVEKRILVSRTWERCEWVREGVFDGFRHWSWKGEITSNIQYHGKGTGWQELIVYFKITSRQNFECSQNKEMITIVSKRHQLLWSKHCILYTHIEMSPCLP